MMEHDELLERVSRLIHEIHMHIGIVRIHLATTLIYRHKDWFYSACCLSHQTCRSCRCNSQTGNISPAVFLHILIQLRVGFLDTVYERIVLLSFRVVNTECPALFRHLH